MCKKPLRTETLTPEVTAAAPEWTEYEHAMHEAAQQQTKALKAQNVTLSQMARHLSFIYAVLAVLVTFWLIGLVVGVLSYISASCRSHER